MTEKQLYTSPEVAEMLGVSHSHVRNMISTGIAKPKQKLGNNWLFTLDEIERLRHRKRTRGPNKKQ